MVTLGEFLNLIDNFCGDAAVVQVFDKDEVAEESELRDDIIGFVFAISPGDFDANEVLDSAYAKSKILNIYVCKKRVIKVLVETCHS